LLKLSNRFPIKEMKIVTKDEEDSIEMEGHIINVVPLWKWLFLNAV